MAGAEERQVVQQDLDDFVRYWLAPARTAPPTIDARPQSATAGNIEAVIAPIRAEDAPWNAWPGATSRLFNNRAAYLFEVSVNGEAVRWVPEGTLLELDEPGRGIPAAPTPDDVLLPLLRAAIEQERWVLEGDLVARTRAAGPFRAAYLPLSLQDGGVTGVVAFPIADPERHVAALRVTLEVESEGNPYLLTWTFE